MSQSTLDDEDLFGEAAQEMRADVEEHLAAARAELPDPDDIWETEADNVLGVLNGLRSALDTGEAQEELRQAKKWYTMGERADAFEDADDLAQEIEDVEELIEQVGDVSEEVGDLTGSIPELRGALQEAQAEAEEEAAEQESEAEEAEESLDEADDSDVQAELDEPEAEAE